MRDSLPWDQVGYWACKIVTALPEAFDSLIVGIGKILVIGAHLGSLVRAALLFVKAVYFGDLYSMGFRW